MTPLLPFLTDTKENVNTLLDYCFDAGVKGIVCFNIGMTLREGDREYYYAQLDKFFPGLSNTYRRKYGNSYNVESDNSKELMKLFHERCEKQGVLYTPDECFAYTSELPDKFIQMSLL